MVDWAQFNVKNEGNEQYKIKEEVKLWHSKSQTIV